MKSSNGEFNKLFPKDRPFHDWYRFVLSFPPHLVRTYLKAFNVTPSQRVLDPFCGTGTTIVECKKFGITSVGMEANGIAHFAGTVKTDWNLKVEMLGARRLRLDNALPHCTFGVS